MTIQRLYDALARSNLYVDTCERSLSQLDDSSLRDLALALAVAGDECTESPGVSDIIANERLAGGPSPCMAPECRLGAAESLGRFSALYATKTWISNPFERYLNISAIHVDALRSLLLGDIAVLYRMRALFEADLLGLVHSPRYCSHH